MAVPKLRFKADDGSDYPEWEKKKLSDIFVERREMQCIDDEYKLLSFTIEQGVINPEDKKTNKRDFLMKDKASKKFLRTEYNDIIYNPANLKYGAINRNKLGKGLLSPIYAIFYTDQNAVFMESVVRNPDFIKRSLKYLEGTVIKLMTLKPRDFLRIKSYIPYLPEQQKIAEFLSTIDMVIAKQRETVSAWEEQKKGVMQKLFSQEVRFRENDGSEFPEWEKKKLGDIVTLFNGDRSSRYPKETDFVADGVVFLNTENLHNSVLDISVKCKYITYEKYCELNGAKIQLLDIIYCLRGSVGLCSLNTILNAGTVASSLMVIRAIDSKINPVYLYNALNSDFVLKQVYQCLNGSCAGNLSAKDVATFKIYVPYLAEQQKIADCLSTFDEVIEKQKATLAAWEELKKGLLQQMFV